MTPQELLNISLQYEVDIECLASIPPIKLITFKFPGCTPLTSIRIPLYLALHLKSLNLCTIIQPSYLSREYIEGILQKEKNEVSFTEIPEFFFEHSYVFMNNEIESLVCELRCIRMNKIWKGLGTMDGKALYINGLSKWEFNEFKEIIKRAMKTGKEILQD